MQTTPPPLRQASLVGLLAVLVLAAPAAAQGFEWRTAPPEGQGFSAARLEALRDALAKRGTKALLVVRHDAIVLEWYAADHAADKKHGTASMAKALVGGVTLAVAVSDGRIAIDAPAAKYVSSWRDDPTKSGITLRQLGSHTSGLEDAEADDLPHEKLTGWKGDFWKRLKPPHDSFSISRDLTPVLSDPGTVWAYSNPGIAMLGYAVTAAMRDAPQKDLRSLLHDRVMRPIGVPDQQWSAGYEQTVTVDGLPLVGTWGGGSFTARASARVGRLMLRQGDWDGLRLISADAVRQTVSHAGLPGDNGMGWWTNTRGTIAKLPRDAFWASGAGHQTCLIVPSLNLICVRNGGALVPLSAGKDASRTAQELYLFGPLMDALTEAPSAAAPVFTCDFESPTWWQEWAARQKDGHTDTVSEDAVRKFAPHRGKALRIRVDQGGHYGVSLDFNFKKRTGAEPEEIYFRYYLRFADDWNPGQGGKLPGIGGTYSRAGWGGRKVNGTDGWSARGLFNGRKDGRTPVGFYCYHADMKGQFGDNWIWDRGGFSGLENNRWYCIEQQARLNTPGKNDGLLRAWVDGQLAFEKIDVRMRDVDTLKIETVWLNLYYGGTWTAKADYHVYIDDVAISRQPIGPLPAKP